MDYSTEVKEQSIFFPNNGLLRIIQYKYELFSDSQLIDQGRGTIYVDAMYNLNQIDLIKKEIRLRLKNVNFDTIDRFSINIINDKNTKYYKIENNNIRNIIFNRLLIGSTYTIFLLGGIIIGRMLFKNNDSV